MRTLLAVALFRLIDPDSLRYPEAGFDLVLHDSFWRGSVRSLAENSLLPLQPHLTLTAHTLGLHTLSRRTTSSTHNTGILALNSSTIIANTFVASEIPHF